MATSQSYATVEGPIATRYFATPDAANWCVITPPPWARSVTIQNRGTLDLFAAFDGDNNVTGAASATGNGSKIASGGVRTFGIVGQKWGVKANPFSVFGLDGATHAMDFTFEAVEP